MSAEKKRFFVCAVLAGGSGTRLWPLSTATRPKPFVPLGDMGTLYEATVSRAKALGGETVTVAGEPLRPLCEAPGVRVLLEPARRNTAAAVALAACDAIKRHGDGAILLVLPSDHAIEGDFSGTVNSLAGLCESEGALGVMGIEPSGPETGYGYLEAAEPLESGFRLARFVEKPDRAKAETMIASGRFAWNSGMFVFPLVALREAMRRHCPEIWSAAEGVVLRGDDAAFRALRPISVDYALMEKAERTVMVRARFSWSDVGNFASLYAILPKDANGNAGWGPGRAESCRNCLLITSRKETLLRGLDGIAFVETGEGRLAVPLSQSEQIREGVEAITAKR
ncbi:MAG: mannose-1-phosphate guanylyltransferase [Acidobacteria bacterium]|nr:mannose-1-phosphate guanylyltransferase [Acidobacteriota bacterium]